MRAAAGEIRMVGTDIQLSFLNGGLAIINQVENLLSGQKVPIYVDGKQNGKAYQSSNSKYLKFRLYTDKFGEEFFFTTYYKIKQLFEVGTSERVQFWEG